MMLLMIQLLFYIFQLNSFQLPINYNFNLLKLYSNNNNIKSLNNYQNYLIDQWGVLHDGKTPYNNVINTLNTLKLNNKTMILLSNSSKRKKSSINGLNRVGINSTNFVDIVTSGELAWNAIYNRNINFLNKSKELKVFIIGNGDDDIEYITSCNCIPSPPEEADFILARGTFAIIQDINQTNNIVFPNPNELINQIKDYLLRCSNYNLPMLVSNPDILRPGANDPMPGQIANIYHDINNKLEIKYIGKPYNDVYNYCFDLLSKYHDRPICKSDIIGIGDSLEHDILGANDAGIDSLWITNGVHSNELDVKEGSNDVPSETNLNKILCKFSHIKPTHITNIFANGFKNE